MAKAMRQSTLETLGLGSVLEMFRSGKSPVNTTDLVDQVFGPSGSRGALVISGANGIVGAGKMMQLGVRLLPFGVPMVGLDMPGAPAGLRGQYNGLAASFGKKQADEIMANIVQLSYDGVNLPSQLKEFRPRFLLEAIPEILNIKKSHYEMFRKAFPEIEIRSVTSGFPSSELGVGVAHPAFPHQINKIWEVVEPKPSPITQLLWALGLIPVPVSDHWSFVLDVLFCGLTSAGTRYHEATNMPFWKLDKYIRRLMGSNPFRAHDAIGAKGANFLTWSCLHHLEQQYGALFAPAQVLTERKESGGNWYPHNHLRPMVNWSMAEEDSDAFRAWILGPLFQMASLLVFEKRGHLSHINAIGELCAQFRSGILATIRNFGAESAIGIVEAYHKLHPEAAAKAWHPEAFQVIEKPEWQQLYVNAEHDGNVGVITLSRESYNEDVNRELNRAIDWLRNAKIERVIVCGDFHLSTQLVGADTNEFFPALENPEEGFRVASTWSETARRLNDEFRISVGFVNGKRCLGGMLELLLHCHYLIAVENADLGAPEVTLPVVPGMELCHWPFRKSKPEHWPKLVQLLLGGKFVKSGEAVGWLTDYAAPLEEALKKTWQVASGGEGVLTRREVEEGKMNAVASKVSGLPESDNPATIAARKAIFECVRMSCGATLPEALAIQARHSADFMTTVHCQNGAVGTEYKKTMLV